MSVFDKIKAGEITNAHGEVNFFRVSGGEIDLQNTENVEPSKNGFIVGHSESGHHHLLEAEGVTMRRGTERGMEILHAIVKSPVHLKQDAGSPHSEQIVEPGEYIITNNIEYNPFSEQARRVAD